MLTLRLLLGVGESVAYPSYSKIIALHYHEGHRGIANSIVSSGLALGPGFGMLAGGILIVRFGWRAFFIVLGLFSLLWLIPWITWMPDAKSAIHVEKTVAPSFAALLRQRSAWGTCIGMFGHNYVNYFLLTWLPFYLVRERHFSMYSMAKIGGAAYIIGACLGITTGWASDRMIRAGATPTRVRKSIVAGGLGRSGNFVTSLCRQYPRDEHSFFDVRHRLPEHKFFKYLGDHADTCRSLCLRALDGSAEFCGESIRDCCAGADGLRIGTHRPFLLAVCDSQFSSFNR